MLLKDFVGLVSKDLYKRAEEAEKLERHGANRPGSVVLRASAGIVESWGRKYDGKVEMPASSRADAVPAFVIIEGRGIKGAEAILVGNVLGVIVDWDEIESDPMGYGLSVAQTIDGHFRGNMVEPDTRIRGIMQRLIDLIGWDEIDPDDDDSDDDSIGTYKGLKHTGKAGCPACKAILADHRAERSGDRPPSLRPAFGDITEQVLAILMKARTNPDGARKEFEDLKREVGFPG